MFRLERGWLLYLGRDVVDFVEGGSGGAIFDGDDGDTRALLAKSTTCSARGGQLYALVLGPYAVVEVARE